ncbi:meiotic recombination protein REC114 [Erinaceus europaeus]|uniref:Meiotic recombination protein REC114 n=1 Tax=Erinaceus europaeus TaxID=9365 RepID=A0ABM3W525_ERIEU|nr:meiotic recombination protein REC114 [Erinaceus europaeus]XP_060031682.1 meiotic recombination protein REC114 [Erinaceus europaeus]
MFRVQFSRGPGVSALGQCSSCVRSLEEFTAVQGCGEGAPGGACTLSPPPARPPRGLEQQADAETWPRTSVTGLAQALLAAEELPLPCERSAWASGELGPFLRLCLLDQNFPAFVEEVERELRALVGGGGRPA